MATDFTVQMTPQASWSVTLDPQSYVLTSAKIVSALGFTPASETAGVTETSITTALGYTPVNPAALGSASTHAASDFDAAGSAASAQSAAQSAASSALASALAGLASVYQTASQVSSAISSAISSALTGYATQAWVSAQGFITSASLTWSNISGKPSTFSPSAHAASHASGGSDAITISSAQVTGLGTAASQNSTAFDAAGAAASAQAYAIQRANQTGTQPASTVTGIAKQIFQGFSVSTFDTSVPTFSSGVLTLMTLKSGGASGTTVNTVTYNYTSGQLTSKVLQDGSGNTLNTLTFTYSGNTLVSKVLS
jgi:uncharacterized protein YjlB